MKALLIAKRDFKSYFSSPVAYLVMAVFLFLIGWIFQNLFILYLEQMKQTMPGVSRQQMGMSEVVLRPLFGNMNVILLFIVPFLTMRLLAEERRDHTIDLLLTAPVKPIHVVMGKFIAAIGYLAILLAITALFPLTSAFVTSPDWGVLFAGYLGIFLVSGAYIAVGLFWSSRTQDQFVAAILTFGTLLFFWLVSWSASSAGPVWSEVLLKLSLINHYTSFAMGVLDTSDVVYYVSVILLGLFLTHLSFDHNG